MKFEYVLCRVGIRNNQSINQSINQSEDGRKAIKLNCVSFTFGLYLATWNRQISVPGSRCWLFHEGMEASVDWSYRIWNSRHNKVRKLEVWTPRAAWTCVVLFSWYSGDTNRAIIMLRAFFKVCFRLLLGCVPTPSLLLWGKMKTLVSYSYACANPAIDV